MSRMIVVVAGAMLSVLVGCASGPTIYSNQNPQVDVRDYKTFGYSRALGTDRPGGQQSIVSTILIDSTRMEMEKRGYVFDANNPDLEINFYLHTKEKIQSTTTPTSVGYGSGYYGYRAGAYGYGTWGGYETRVTQYTEGTLNIDLIDNARDILVWEGAAVGRMKDKQTALHIVRR